MNAIKSEDVKIYKDKAQSYFSKIPREVGAHMFSFLDENTLHKTAKLGCKYFYSIVDLMCLKELNKTIWDIEIKSQPLDPSKSNSHQLCILYKKTRNQNYNYTYFS